MWVSNLAQAVLAFAMAGLTASAVLWAFVRLDRQRGLAGSRAPDAGHEPVSILFDGPLVVDVTERAQSVLTLERIRTRDRAGILHALGHRFPGLAAQAAQLDLQDRANLYSRDHSEIAILRRQGHRLKLTLEPVETGGSAIEIDRPTMMSVERELAALRATTDSAPFLVWRQNRKGEITWANRAYDDACAVHGDPAQRGLWPIPKLFDLNPQTLVSGGAKTPDRMRLGGDGGQAAQWFQFHITSLDDDFLITAMNVDPIVEAEASLRNFVQTLSITFADLPIGLAVFTRDRRLALFNPALGDLTTISPEDLIARPTIFGFLDMLRDRQMMPEPKNYQTWRDQITELEASAVDGTYCETWHLPSDRTFRVTGRPQMDGAVALLFEDISDEIGMTRRFRNELDVGQSVLDSMDDALAVFSPNGVLTMTNAAYDALWALDTREGLDTLFIADALRCWKAGTAPNEVWNRFRSYAESDARREAWSANARLLDGRALLCTFRPLPGGSTLVRFAVRSRLREPLHTAGSGQPRRQAGGKG